MAQKSAAMLRVITENGAITRPAWIKRLRAIFDVRKTRIDLSKLTDEQLCDIGLTHEDVEAELARQVWDVPPNWRR